MAEFQEVIKQYKRMCDNNDCCDCPFFDTTELSYYKINNSCNSLVLAHPEVYEPIIMQWAAEHPDPVYPTYYEWLANMGIVPIELPPDQAIMVTDIGLLKKIPADIAQNLGIETKEGT